MAWTAVPVEVGQPILADHVNELRTAGIERQIWVSPTVPPAAVAAGDDYIDGLHADIRSKIVTSVSTGRWKWPTGGGNYKTWHANALGDADTNIFNAAFGEMSWRNSVDHGAPKLAECINDTKAVFDLMRYVAGSIENYESVAKHGYWPEQYAGYALPNNAYAYWSGAWRDNSLALADADDLLGFYAVTGSILGHFVTCLDDTMWEGGLVDPYYSISQELVAQTYRVSIPYTYPIDWVSGKFTTHGFREEVQYWNAAPNNRTVYRDPARTITVFVRLNGSAPPTGDYDTRTTEGAEYASVVAANPEQTRVFEALVNGPVEQETFLTVYADRGLPSECGLEYTAYGWLSAAYGVVRITEKTEWGFPFGLLCRCGFEKVA